MTVLCKSCKLTRHDKEPLQYRYLKSFEAILFYGTHPTDKEGPVDEKF